MLPYDARIATHYEILGVDPDAPAPVIRASYRARARMLHPDRSSWSTERTAPAGATPGAGGTSMAELNEAYRVLSDPGRRAVYDRSLAGGTAAGGTAGARVDAPVVPETPVVRPNPLSPDGPARFPWKGLLVAGVIGSALVLVSAALSDPPAEEPPDGILRTGSCVVIEPNGDAREVACTGEDDVVVELLIPTEAKCPVDLEPHRDRLGLGIACIAP